MLIKSNVIQISQNFESPINPDQETSFSELITAGLMEFIGPIEEVSNTATKEFALEEILQRMQAEWNNIRFEFLPYRSIPSPFFRYQLPLTVSS